MFKRSLGAAGGYALLVHGGAGDAEGARLQGQAAGCARAAGVGKALLEAGASALDAVQAAVEVLEDDPRFNAGTGGALTSEGALELDASIMEGSSLRAGAVCALPPFKHPIAIARAVLADGKHVLYAAQGAARFALQHGFSAVAPETMITDDARQALARALAEELARRSGGTVGAVARDERGGVAAATSTGGMMAKRPGRIGDSPIVGAGSYADDALGAASATGEGEGILRVALCSRVVSQLAGHGPADAALDALRYMEHRVAAIGGLIVVSKDGQLGVARSTKSMSFAGTWRGHDVVAGG
ncbi:MAG TPA: isoaspartyl peptidase/L-asparaginase [Polyangiales bacterium]